MRGTHASIPIRLLFDMTLEGRTAQCALLLQVVSNLCQNLIGHHFLEEISIPSASLLDSAA